MDIIIKPENRAKLEKAMEEVQGRKKVRLMDYETIVLACEKCDEYLESIGFGAKAAKEGIVIHADPLGYPISNKEKTKTWLNGYAKPESTQMYLTFKNGTWRVQKFVRKETGRYERYRAVFTDKQKRRIIENLAGFEDEKYKLKEDIYR